MVSLLWGTPAPPLLPPPARKSHRGTATSAIWKITFGILRIPFRDNDPFDLLALDIKNRQLGLLKPHIHSDVVRNLGNSYSLWLRCIRLIQSRATAPSGDVVRSATERMVIVMVMTIQHHLYSMPFEEITPEFTAVLQ